MIAAYNKDVGWAAREVQAGSDGANARSAEAWHSFIISTSNFWNNLLLLRIDLPLGTSTPGTATRQVALADIPFTPYNAAPQTRP